MGHLADYISALPSNATTLDLHHLLQLSGTIPSDFLMPQFTDVIFRGMGKISGTLPQEIWLHHDLQIRHVAFGGCHAISGTLPTEVGALHVHDHHHDERRRRRLHNGHEHHAPDAPEGEGFLFSFQQLALSGTIPTQLGHFAELNSLSLMGSTRISGFIPTQLGAAPLSDSLKVLDVAELALSGSVPPQLGHLSSLEHLYLFGNSLSGALPTQLADLHLPDHHDDSCLLTYEHLLGLFTGRAECDEELGEERCAKAEASPPFLCPLPPFRVNHSLSCLANLACVAPPPRPASPPEPSSLPRPPNWSQPASAEPASPGGVGGVGGVGETEEEDAGFYGFFFGADAERSSAVLVGLMLLVLGLGAAYFLHKRFLRPWLEARRAHGHNRQLDEVEVEVTSTAL